MFLPDSVIRDLSQSQMVEKKKYTVVEDWGDGIGQTTSSEVIDEVHPYANDSLTMPLINPFEEFVDNALPSHGLSAYGYDVRMAKDHIKIFTPINGGIIDPLNHDDKNFVKPIIKVDESNHKYILLPPQAYLLAYTREYFSMPKDVSALVLGKSTYARCGIEVNTTVIEAGFHGNVVLEMSNASNLPVKIYIDGGIAQFMFVKGWDKCEADYSIGARKYQGQTGLTHAK